MAVYFIKNSRTGSFKIGKSDDPSLRLRELQTGNEDPLELIVSIPGDNVVERQFHAAFDELKIRGEWFRESPRLDTTIDRLHMLARLRAEIGEPGQDTLLWFYSSGLSATWLKLWLIANGLNVDGSRIES